jgi:hypothetical protein
MFKIKFTYPNSEEYFLAKFTWHWIDDKMVSTPVFSVDGLRNIKLFKNEEIAWSYWIRNGKNYFEIFKNQGVIVSVENNDV